MDRRLAGKAAPALFTLRALPVVPLSLISAAAGVLRLPLKTFTVWTFLGSVPRCFVLGGLGYLTRGAYEGLAANINTAESLLSAGLAAAAAGAILFLRSRAKRRMAGETG